MSLRDLFQFVIDAPYGGTAILVLLVLRVGVAVVDAVGNWMRRKRWWV